MERTNRRMVRPAALALALLLCLLSLTPTLLATATEEATPTVTERMETISDLTALEERLYRGMMAEEARIDLTGIAPAPTPDDVAAAMQHLSNAAPELFHVGTNYTTSISSGVAIALTPIYTLTGAALAAARAEYLLILDTIAAEVDPTWSDAEICLYLHDYLCVNFAYDTSYEIYDAYGFLTRGTGVCQAYTLTYAALLSRFDIPVTYATGKDGNVLHIWSIVTLDGESYHVDVTWGDPLAAGQDGFGTATHDNFLKSDTAIDLTGHTERQNRGGVVCDDTRYDDAPFTEAMTATAVLDGTVYAITDGRVLALDDTLTTAREIYAVTDRWQTGISYLTRRPACVAAYGNLLYLNTPTAIISLDPQNGLTETVLSVQDGLILTLLGKGADLYYEVATTIHATDATVKTHTLPPAVPPCTGEHTLGLLATMPATCAAPGVSVYRCTVCDYRVNTPLPPLPHEESATLVPPGYGTDGYTERTCTVCGHSERTDIQPALPMPTVSEYEAAVQAAVAASDPTAFLSAVRTARDIEPYLPAGEIDEARSALDAACNAYDSRAAAINSDFGEVVTSAMLVDAGLLSYGATAFAILLLALRRIFAL